MTVHCVVNTVPVRVRTGHPPMHVSCTHPYMVPSLPLQEHDTTDNLEQILNEVCVYYVYAVSHV